MNPKFNADGRPWYREPWPWLVMLGPAIVIVAGLVTAYLAVISDDGLVADDYYKEGLAINQRTARDHRAAELAVEAELFLGDGGDRVRVVLRGKEGMLLPEALVLRISHPTRPGLDQKVELRSEVLGVYDGRLVPLHGRWRIALEDKQQEWLLAGEWETGTQAALRLTAAAGGKSGGDQDLQEQGR